MVQVSPLTAKLLIAMPGMGDPRFARSVVFLCAHSADGAMGLIVNKPAADVNFPALLDQLDIPHSRGARDIRVHFGGPVEHGRGFVLHSAEYRSAHGTMTVDGGTSLSATLDVLERLAEGRGPERALFALGYSGWGPGQLEAEIAQNGWLVADAEADILFDAEDDSKWSRALALLGADPASLSAISGRA